MTGGVFNLIVATGRMDRLLHASELLQRRIHHWIRENRRHGRRDPPSIVFIEVTHKNHFYAAWKPFVALAFEYTRVHVNSGTVGFGNTIQFSIPQFGEFFADMALHLNITAAACTAGVLPAAATVGAAAAAGTSPSADDVKGRVEVAAGNNTTWRWVNANGILLADGDAASNYVQYCSYPAIRSMKKTAFQVNGNPLDSYTRRAALYYVKQGVPKDKRAAFNRCVGQENPYTATSDLFNCLAAPSGAGAGSPLAQFTSGSSDRTDVHRRQLKVVNGPQTPKATQPMQDWFAPIRFWFCKDFRLSMPSIAIPNGQRFVYIDLAAQNEIIQACAGNVFLETQSVNTAAATAPTAVEVYRDPYYIGSSAATASTLVNPTLTAELYVNNLFVNPEIHDIYIERIGFQLIRVHLEQEQTQQVATAELQLTQLKWPLEYAFITFAPTANYDSSTSALARASFDTWDQFSVLTETNSDEVQESFWTQNGAGVAGVATTQRYRGIGNQQRFHYFVESDPIDTLTIVAHGNILYPEFKVGFYDSYLPYMYGGQNIVTPTQRNIYFITFCLYPGTYQPSGYLNVSRAREFFIKYTSTYISSSTPVFLHVLGMCINFLLVSDGSAVLRFST
jgi:hypothetical protein